MQNQIFISISTDELKHLISSAVSEAIKQEINIPEAPTIKEDELIKTKELAELLSVSSVTIHNWKIKGLLPFYRISNKVYFKKNEVLEALKKGRIRNVG